MGTIDLNDKFQIGRFYGFTAPQLMLTSRATLSQLLSIVSNTTSVDSLNDLLIELTALEAILTSSEDIHKVFIYSETAQTDEYLKQLKKLAPHIYTIWGEPKDFKQLQRKRVSTLTSLDKALTANEIGQDYTPFVKSLGLTDIDEVIQWKECLRKVNESATSISNKVELDYPDYKDTVLISSDATKLLNAVYNGMMHTEGGKTKLRWLEGKIKSTLLTKVSNNTQYFGEDLWTLNNFRSPLQFNRINKPYSDSISSDKNPNSVIATLERYLQQCSALLYYDKTETQDNHTEDFNLPTTEEFKEYLYKGKTNSFVGKLAITFGDEERANLVIRIAKLMGVKSSWYNTEVLKAIFSFYSAHKIILEADILTKVQEQYEDEEAIQDMFNELAMVGVLGLTVYGVDIMIEEIERQSLARKESLKTTVEPTESLQINTVIMMSDAESKLARLQMNKEREEYYAYESLGNIRL